MLLILSLAARAALRQENHGSSPSHDGILSLAARAALITGDPASSAG